MIAWGKNLHSWINIVQQLKWNLSKQNRNTTYTEL
jgi:hypothetical protein